MPVTNANHPPVKLILCPHLSLDERGHLDYTKLDVWGARDMDYKTYELDAAHTPILCPACGDIVTGNVLRQLVKAAITDGVRNVIKPSWFK